MEELNLTVHVNSDNCKLITTNLLPEVNDKLNEITYTYQSKANDGKGLIIYALRNLFGYQKFKMSDGISYQFSFNDETTVYPTDLLYIKNVAYELLTNTGFKVDPNYGNIELYYYEIADGEKGTTKFAPHVDDDGYNNYPVETCIFYTQKDESIIDGNLDYYIPDPNKAKKWYSKFIENYGEKQELKVENGTVALLSGNLYHCPQDYSGYGKRNCIVVQLRSLKRFT